MSIDIEALLAGPRGRRLMLELALAAGCGPGRDGDELAGAVMLAAYRLDPGRGTSRVMFGPGAAQVDTAMPSPAEVAALLDDACITVPDEGSLLQALDRAVASARYWQEPDGEDALAATPAVLAALAPIAAQIAASPHAAWWSEGVARDDQWQVHWDEGAGGTPPAESAGASEALEMWRSRTIAGEERARRERPTDPEARWGGQWWSTPPHTLLRTTRGLGELGPAGLWLEEDSSGWDRATTRAVSVADGVRVYEIDGAQAWADLCRGHPLGVTAEKRHDWYRTTGRAGDWVIPDWSRVASSYDAVHLTVGGYLAAAGTPIEVDEATSSVIGGWAPDETFWLCDVGQARGPDETWVHDADRGWGRTR